MVDIHCHILPGVDDGSPSMEDSLEMARMAADSGVTDIIATPHCNLPGNGPKNYRSASLRAAFSRLQQALDAEGIPLRIHPGAEVFCTPELPRLLDQRQLQTLGGSRYLLVEFYFDESAEFMEQCFRDIRHRGLVPVAAHPERYNAVQRDPARLEGWFRRGIVIQLNKGSVLGRLGRRVFLFSSVSAAEGKSTLAANTAISLASRGVSVLFIDLDLRRPVQSEMLGLSVKQKNELGTLLSESAAPEKILSAAVTDPSTGLHSLLSTKSYTDVIELLASDQLAKVVALAREQYDYVIIDSPPLGFFSDSELLSDLSDASVLVVRQDTVPAPEINDAIDALRAGKAEFLGCILNDMVHLTAYSAGYGYGYGYYGYGYGKKYDKYGYGHRSGQKQQ